MVAQISPALTRNMLGLSIHFMVGYRRTLNRLSGGSGRPKAKVTGVQSVRKMENCGASAQEAGRDGGVRVRPALDLVGSCKCRRSVPPHLGAGAVWPGALRVPAVQGSVGGGGPPVAGRGAVWEEAGVLPGLESWVGEIGAGSPLNWVDLWVRKAFRVP